MATMRTQLRLALLLLFIGLPLASTTCRARGYGSPGSACQNTQCSSWGVGSRCCGTRMEALYCTPFLKALARASDAVRRCC